MPSRPYEAHPKKENRNKHPRSTNYNARQHGHLHGPAHAASGTRDVLLSIPSESLTHVTAYLDPPDLLALSRTCKQLHAHVTDDNTWRRAYVHQYLGISPESDLRDEAGDKTLMLRREENSWRKEFILRYNLRRYVMSICASEVVEDLVCATRVSWSRYMRFAQTRCCNEVGYILPCGGSPSSSQDEDEARLWDLRLRFTREKDSRRPEICMLERRLGNFHTKMQTWEVVCMCCVFPGVGICTLLQ
ncbi:hypothetical protein L226DRAFT_350963 [Lentinus tigrinus ALCF2SS1-7]|nr:hypothetical protein L226DRAFT_350963 [Lentinus tigrinus ALCF2SS1-7]